jgi:glycosyltransferase involved in cell wall biosynthesis
VATHTVLMSPQVVEESGGLGVAAHGFATSLASLGFDVQLIASFGRHHNWLVDEERARSAGFTLTRIRGANFRARYAAFVDAASAQCSPRTVLWVNGIWGPQSLAAWTLHRRFGSPMIIGPAGSLGRAALRYRRWKKAAYYQVIERHILRAAARIHCLSERERQELPPSLKWKAFVAPAGIDLDPAGKRAPAPLPTFGVLARIHPIKRQHLLLDAAERLMRSGVSCAVEFAGTTSDQTYADVLHARVAGSDHLRSRVTFHGHVSKSRVQAMVSRWTAACLLSEQENFGHAVLSTTAAGVPTVVSRGVGLAADLERAGAGVVADDVDEIVEGLLGILHEDAAARERACLSFAQNYSWSICGGRLAQEIAGLCDRLSVRAAG